MRSGVLILTHRCIHMLKARLWIRKEASGLGGARGTLNLCKFMYLLTEWGKICGDGESHGACSLSFTKKPLARGHLIAGPGSRGDRFLAFL